MWPLCCASLWPLCCASRWTPADPEGRDVFNEAPSKEDQLVAAQTETQRFIGKQAVIHTTMGDITVQLYPTECPRTVENFW